MPLHPGVGQAALEIFSRVAEMEEEVCMSNYERFLFALNAIDSKLIVHRFYHYISWQKGFAVGELRTRRCDIFKFRYIINKFSKARHHYSLIGSESF